VHWAIVREMGLAWMITLPASALLAVGFFELLQWLT
jgi:phosphate/sulfate permease